MLTTLHGRVELDPMRVPLAASMSAGRDDRFEQVLQKTVAAEEPVAPEPVAERVDEQHRRKGPAGIDEKTLVASRAVALQSQA